MPRNMSFSVTSEQVRQGTKTVTRRLGWKYLLPGTILNAVEKAMGLKKGETVTVIRLIRVVSVRAESLSAITAEDCVHEGFPEMTPAEFVALFCQVNQCTPEQEVRRIEFEYL